MLQNPHQQLPESGAAACCGMLLPLVLASLAARPFLEPSVGGRRVWGAMTSGLEITRMILISCQTLLVQQSSMFCNLNVLCLAALAAQTRLAPHVALRSLLLHDYSTVSWAPLVSSSRNGSGGVPSTLSKCTSWYFRVYAVVCFGGGVYSVCPEPLGVLTARRRRRIVRVSSFRVSSTASVFLNFG